jgi:hypothetical protein
MRIGTSLGNDAWISMGPVGWFIYFFLWRPIWLVICIVLYILITLYRLSAWCVRKLVNAARGHSQMG